MKTEFKYYDENQELKSADIIISLEYNDKKYIVYEDEEDNDSENEVLQIRELEENGEVYPNLNIVDDETLLQIKDILLSIYNGDNE